MTSHDVIVIGAGMFGSSTAKHLRKLRPNLRVAVIGPEDNNNAHARGQHHDEARITRRVENRVQWEFLNSDSMIHYREVEQESGIDFYTPCGVVWIAPPEDKEAIVKCFSEAAAVIGSDKVPFCVSGDAVTQVIGRPVNDESSSWVTVTSLAETAVALMHNQVALAHFKDADKPTYYVTESGPAGGGTVHPNRYVQAQLTIAAQTLPTEMYTHVKESVVKVVPKDGAYEVTTEKGTVHRAKKVVVATGYWCRYHQLLPERITSRLKPQSANVVLLRVRAPHGEDHAANLKAVGNCPSVIRTTGTMPQQFYCLPPRYYEKYKGWFIKMGEVDPVKRLGDLTTCEGAVAWYNGEVPLDAETVENVSGMLKSIYVHWPVETVEQPAPYQNRYTVTCMVDETAEGVPIIDKVDGNGLYSCVGGNGRGAKSCDAIGCVTAHRMLDVKLPPAMAYYEAWFHENDK